MHQCLDRCQQGSSSRRDRRRSARGFPRLPPRSHVPARRAPGRSRPQRLRHQGFLEADATNCQTIGLTPDLVVAERTLLAVLFGRSQEAVDGSRVPVERVVGCPSVVRLGRAIVESPCLRLIDRVQDKPGAAGIHVEQPTRMYCLGAKEFPASSCSSHFQRSRCGLRFLRPAADASYRTEPRHRPTTMPYSRPRGLAGVRD